MPTERETSELIESLRDRIIQLEAENEELKERVAADDRDRIIQPYWYEKRKSGPTVR